MHCTLAALMMLILNTAIEPAIVIGSKEIKVSRIATSQRIELSGEMQEVKRKFQAIYN